MSAIHLHLTSEANRLAVALHNGRPVLTPLWVGQTPTVAELQVGQWLPLCAAAQRLACRYAARAAQGDGAITPSPAAHAALAAEMLATVLWRWGLEFPTQLGQTPDWAAIRPLRQQLLALVSQYLRADALALDAATTDNPLIDDAPLVAAQRAVGAIALPQHAAALGQIQQRGWQDAGKTAVTALPLVAWTSDALAQALVTDPTFGRQPHWDGKPTAVAPWPMSWGSGLGEALAAEGDWLTALLTGDACAFAPIAVGTLEAPARRYGWATVATRRGPLIHAVALEHGVIGDYHSLAPTEWQCRAQGPLHQALASLDLTQAAVLAPWLVFAHDPCAAVEISGDCLRA